MSQTRMQLEGRRHIQLTQERTLQVSVVDRDPKMAAAIANAHARQLDRLDRRLLAEMASERRLFFQERAEEAFAKLAKAEEEWYPVRFVAGLQTQSGSKQHGRSKGQKDELPGNTLTANRIAMLKLRLMVLEVQRSLLRRIATPIHPAVSRLEARMQRLREAIEQIEGGSQIEGDGSGQQLLFPPQDRLPQLALDSSRLAREARIQGRLYFTWRQMLEDATIAESLDLPRLWVLDWAIPSERRPKVWQTTLAAGSLALLFGVMISFVLSYLDRRDRLES